MHNSRITWIDNAKAVAIILVVFGHYVDTPMVKAYVYSFHMHLFFFLSGFLFTKNTTFIELIKKRSKNILLPYFIFSFLNYGFFLLRREYGATPDLSIGKLQKLYDIFLWNEFWFLGVLFLVSIFYYFISDYLKSVIKFVFFILLCTFIHYVSSKYLSSYLHENLIKCFTALVFYGTGSFLKNYIDSGDLYHKGKSFFRADKPLNAFLLPKKLKVQSLYYLLVFSLYAILFYMTYQKYGLINITFYENYFCLYLLGFLGIFLILLLSQLIESNKLIQFIGENTILIYLLEGYPPAIIKRAMKYILHIDNFSNINSLYALLYTCMTISILFPVIFIINRHIPFIIGRPKSAK
jgi:acyltransferase